MEGRAIAIAIPFFLALIGFEAWVDARRRRRGQPPLYRFADAITSLACGVGQQVLGALAIGALGIFAYAFAWSELRIFTIPDTSIAGWVFAFVAVDLGYYAYHWASHRINFFWATHVVHHQSEEYNLTTALRQSWFTALTSWIFYVPLAIVGVSPLVFLLCMTLNTLYQFWIHTRAVGKLGVFERVMNTPSHHRVHHGIDPEYIDKNYGGVFIVWDRLFGTFTEETFEPAYGTVKPLASFNPVWANFEGFARLVSMSRATDRWRDKLLVWVMPPEWQPDDLGGRVIVPPVDHASRVKYGVRTTRPLRWYVGASFLATAGLVFAVLWFGEQLTVVDKVLLVGVAVATLVSWGALFEKKRWALPFEAGRVVAAVAAVAIVVFN